jgi:hypothetical protein
MILSPNKTTQVPDKMYCSGNNVAANAEQVYFCIDGFALTRAADAEKQLDFM